MPSSFVARRARREPRSLFLLPLCAALLLHGCSVAHDAQLPFALHLHVPPGAPPHPVAINLHGCSGFLPARSHAWTQRLNAWGYAVLKVDSFTRRGDPDICDDVMKVSPMRRLSDVSAAINRVRADVRLDDANIFLMGTSHGGTTALLAHLRADFSALKGVIAFYPECPENLPLLLADTLILIGELDDWTPAQRCRDLKAGLGDGRDLELVVYPGAYHSFDVPGANGVYYGHKLVYDEAAAHDGIERVRGFLRSRTTQLR